jgi:hypothetical protein
MTGNQLIEEGNRIARPCVHLVAQDSGGGNLAGVWKGPGIVPAPAGAYRHWLSVNCGFLPGQLSDLKGCLSIYTNEDDCGTGTVAFSASRSVAVEEGGVPLFARPTSSLPPIEAIFKFGSTSVQQWLAANQWQPDWGYNPNFADAKTAELYVRTYQKLTPLYSGGAHAILGGWHFPWPDDDWDQLIDQILVAWTLHDSEPWVEVWYDGSFRVKERIT